VTFGTVADLIIDGHGARLCWPYAADAERLSARDDPAFHRHAERPVIRWSASRRRTRRTSLTVTPEPGYDADVMRFFKMEGAAAASSAAWTRSIREYSHRGGSRRAT